MKIKPITCYSENPESDLWREILQYTYKENVRRFLEQNGHEATSQTMECIIGSFLQAHEYYKATSNASLQIAPLLLYYGSTNLLYGMTNLLSGRINKINNHGMKIFLSDENRFIADTGIHFLSPDDGGVHVFSKLFKSNIDFTQYGDWTLFECLASIAEINANFMQCYNVPVGKIVLLDLFTTPDGKLERVYFNEENKKEIHQLLQDVEGISKSYLPITSAQDRSASEEYYILRHKLNGHDISEVSYSGQPYLRAAHIKNGKAVTIPTIFNMYIALFGFSSLCRYYPERWSPFILNDSTGEKLLVEKFLYFARRMIPNIVLEIIFGKKVNYVLEKYRPNDTVKPVGEHQIKGLVSEEIQRQAEETQFSQYRTKFNF